MVILILTALIALLIGSLIKVRRRPGRRFTLPADPTATRWWRDYDNQPYD